MQVALLREDLAKAIHELQFNLYDEDLTIDLMDLYRDTYTTLPFGISHISLICLVSTYMIYHGMTKIYHGRDTNKQISADKFLCTLFNDKVDRLNDYTYVDLIKETFEIVRVDKHETLEKIDAVIFFFSSIIRPILLKKYDLRLLLSYLYITNNKSCILKDHPKINKLYWNVIFRDEAGVKTSLINNDPRSRNNRAYRLALETKNSNNVGVIKRAAIIRTLLQKEVLMKFIASLSLVNDIYWLISTML